MSNTSIRHQTEPYGEKKLYGFSYRVWFVRREDAEDMVHELRACDPDDTWSYEVEAREGGGWLIRCRDEGGYDLGWL